MKSRLKFSSVVMVVGICNSVSVRVFFDMPPWWRWRISNISLSRLGLLIGNRWMSWLQDHAEIK